MGGVACVTVSASRKMAMSGFTCSQDNYCIVSGQRAVKPADAYKLDLPLLR